jgi:HAD superfamily hydrolase (TIGR01509 family)
MIKAILFDLDGVLVEARELHYEALNQALARFGYTIKRDEHLSTYDGLPTRKKLEMLTKQKGLPESIYDDIWKEKQKQTQRIIETTFERDGRIVEILEKLKQGGYKMAVCSNSIRETVELMLKKRGFADYMEFLISNQDVRFSKPHPEIFLRAMVELGVGPRECVVVEDSHHGREAGYAAGAHVCGVSNTSDVTHEKIMGTVKKAQEQFHKTKVSPRWQNSDLRIVIPMAGEGKSFERAGFTFPKPLIDIQGKPMIQRVVENINADAKFIFVVLKEHFERYSLSHLLNLIAPGCDIVVLDKPTEGALVTVLTARKYIENEHPLAVVNADQVIDWNSNEFFYAMDADECDGGIVTFTSTHPKWSFVKLREDGFVGEVAEKKPISDMATAGVYYFRRGEELVRRADRMIEKDIRTRGEFFFVPVFNEFVSDNKKIRAFPVQKVWGLGTPEDVDAFVKKNN